MRARSAIQVKGKDGKVTSYRVDVHLEGKGAQWESFRGMAEAEARAAQVNAALFTAKAKDSQSEKRERVPLNAAVAACVEGFDNVNTKKAYLAVAGDLTRAGVKFIDEITKDTVYGILRAKEYRRKTQIKKIVFIDLIVRRACRLIRNVW